MPACPLTFTPCRLLSEPQRIEAASLAVQAMSSLYDAVGDAVVATLAGEFLIADGELGQSLAVMDPDVAGLVAAYPAEQLKARQAVSLHHALGSLDRDSGARLIARLRELSAMVPQAGLAGSYIARFAVRSDRRGSGLANDMMEVFVSDHPLVTLHVRTDNDRAISFYRRHGFVSREQTDDFVLMRRG